jgi:alpha-D-xyloside xylohydrolase
MRKLILLVCIVMHTSFLYAQTGVTILRAGTPDKFTPETFRPSAAGQLPSAPLPFDTSEVKIRITDRGCIVELPLSRDEQVYGFGMQINSFNQTGKRVRPITNDSPVKDAGYTHAPVPMYVSNKGYAVLINTLRYPTFYCGSNPRRTDIQTQTDNAGNPALNTDALYTRKQQDNSSMIVDIPGAKGIEVIIFAGPDMKQAIQRYNLYAGGGAMPPLWGLGVKYRVKADFNQQQVMNMAGYFREHHIPVDVFGLEPGWQTAAYSCSYVWNTKRFPQPQQLAADLLKEHLRMNLWEHGFVNHASPLYTPLLQRSGDFPVWGGLVPDFADSVTRNIFGTYHDTALIAKGVSGFKFDECDNSDLGGGDRTWSFPEASQFPSGISGEQMHQTFGNLYFRAVYQKLQQRNQRAYFDIRNLGAFASSYPAVLYSDIYEYDEYVRMVPNAGFCGILWSPEVRESSSINELARRTQTAVLSAQTVFNSWYLRSPPWLQYNTELNNKDSLLPDATKNESIIRQLLNDRMQLAPYLYHAFFDYAYSGIPPFRALVVDYPTDKKTYDLENEYLIGEGLLAAPVPIKDSAREVYFPTGDWYNFNTHEKYAGGQSYKIHVGLDELPLFVKGGTILPLAAPRLYLDAAEPFDITCYVFGSSADMTTQLLEDDGVSERGEHKLISLSWKKGHGTSQPSSLYKVRKWVQIP